MYPIQRPTLASPILPRADRVSVVLHFAAGLLAALTPLAALHAQSNYATPYTFTTLAAPAGWFAGPAGVTVDGAGNVYVAEADSHAIRKITPAGVVTTLAGSAENPGSVDGTGTAAQFNRPAGLAVDGSGNVYVVDQGNETIRKITPAGVVTTLAGVVGNQGSDDGSGATARFFLPAGVAVDRAGTVYVADNGNATIRKITPTGVVTTLAGSAGAYGSDDGTGSAARFESPNDVSVDRTGNLYVANWGNNTIRKITPAGVVTTLAGHAYFAGGYQDGTGDAAWFDGPAGVAADGAGTVYVADWGNNAIRKITPAGVVTTLAGSALNYSGSDDGAGGAARFNGPTRVAVDGAGTVYVADRGNHTIRKITPAGLVTTLTVSLAGPGAPARFESPTGVAVDGAGTIYVADTCIRKITPAGVGTALASPWRSGSAREYLSYPQAVAVAATGNLYLADSDVNWGAFFGGYIRKITPAGEITTLAGDYGYYHDINGRVDTATFFSPAGVAVDGAGTVYVADSRNNSISKITGAGVIVLAGTGTHYSDRFVHGSTDGTGGEARFDDPHGVAVDGAGTLYVADTGNHTIRKITPAGNVTTFAGKAGQSGSADGTGSDARFDSPAGVAVDAIGNVFVADTGNSTIRRITPAGVVSTLAGTAGSQGSNDATGSAALFDHPSAVTVDASGKLYIADTDNNTVRIGQAAGPPRIVAQPQNQAATPGNGARFTVIASGIPSPTYQWYFNGSALGGATDSSLNLNSVLAANAGAYTVVVTNALGSVTSNQATLTVSTATPVPAAGSGGGGAIEGWFVLVLLASAATRRWATRTTDSCSPESR